HHGTAGMQNKPNTGCKKLRTIAAGNLRCKFLGKVPCNTGKIHPRLFKDTAFLHDARSATASAFPGPEVFSKFRSIQFLKPAADPILKAFEELFRSLAPHHGR